MAEESKKITLREPGPEDAEFLYRLYTTTRAEEIAGWGWDEAQAEPFLRMQLRARDQSHRMYYEGLEDSIVLLDGEPAGRFIMTRTDSLIRIVDVAILPEYRGRGVGRFLFERVIEEAARTDRPVWFLVEKANVRALKLYESVGFSVARETQTHYELEWRK